jgi:DNA replication licensing factor MCM5
MITCCFIQKSTGAAAVRTPYIRIVGLEVDQHNSGRGKPHFTDAEEEEFIRMSRQHDLYETLTGSLAPSIFGNEGKWNRRDGGGGIII